MNILHKLFFCLAPVLLLLSGNFTPLPAHDPHLALSEYAVERYTTENGLPVDLPARYSRIDR